MYKPGLVYVLVAYVCVYLCVCVCAYNISTKNSRPVLFYQHLGIVAVFDPKAQAAPKKQNQNPHSNPTAGSSGRRCIQNEICAARVKSGFLWTDEHQLVLTR